LTNLLLAKGEVAGARIQDDVDPPSGKTDSRWIRHPSVLADLKSDPDSAKFKEQIPQWDAVWFDSGDSPLGPRLEPTRLVVQAIPGQVLLRGQSRNGAVHEERRRVVDSAAVEHGQPHGDGHPGSGRGDFPQRLPSTVDDPGREKSVLAAVTGNAKLGKAEQGNALGPCQLDRLDDAAYVS